MHHSARDQKMIFELKLKAASFIGVGTVYEILKVCLRYLAACRLLTITLLVRDHSITK